MSAEVWVRIARGGVVVLLNEKGMLEVVNGTAFAESEIAVLVDELEFPL